MRTLFLLLLAAVPAAFPAKKEQPKPAVIESRRSDSSPRPGQSEYRWPYQKYRRTTGNEIGHYRGRTRFRQTTANHNEGRIGARRLSIPEPMANFMPRCLAPPRAVYFRLSFEEGSGRDLKAVNEGPFAIE